MQFMRNDRVLHIITRLDKGGSAENTLRTVQHLGRERATLIAGKTHDPDNSVKAFIQEHDIDCVFMPLLVREIDLFNDLRVFWKLFIFMRKNKYNIVHTHSSKAGILGRWAAWCAGVKTIIHTPHGHVFYGYFGPFKTRFFIILERVTTLITDKIITLTDRGKSDHLKERIAPAHKLITIPSGICIEDYSVPSASATLKRVLGIPEEAIVVGTVSRLDPIKGNRYFIEAIRLLHDENPVLLDNMHFLFVGDGEEADELKMLVYEHGLSSKVTFTGMRKDTKDMYSIIDIFVLASLMEGMGRVIIEAMVQAKPVIATNVGGIPELVCDGVTGVLVEPKDPQALAQAIIGLFQDRSRAHRLGEEGKRFVCGAEVKTSRFNITSMLEHIDNVYNEYKEVRL